MKLWLGSFMLFCALHVGAFASSSVISLPELLSLLENANSNNAQKQLEKLLPYQHRLKQLSVEQQKQYYLVVLKHMSKMGQYRQIISMSDSAMALFAGEQNALNYGIILQIRAYAFESLGDYDKASKLYQTAKFIAQSHNDLALLTQTLTNLGAISYIKEDYNNALILLNEALLVAEELNKPFELGFVYSELALLHGRLNKLEDEQVYVEKSIEYFLQAGKSDDAVTQLANLATNLGGQGKYDRSNDIFLETIKQSQEFGFIESMYYSYVGLSNNYLSLGNAELALSYLEKAEQYVKQIQHAQHPIYFQLNKANLYIRLQDYQQALTSIEQANTMANSSANDIPKSVKADLLNMKADALYGIGNLAEAVKYKKRFKVALEELYNEKWLKNTEEFRVQFLKKRADADKKFYSNEQRLSKSRIEQARLTQEKKQMQMIVVCLLIIAVCYFLYKQLRNQAMLRTLTRVDELTGLLNRARIFQLGQRKLESAIAHNKPLSVFIIDIDHFKQVNDTHGHSVGDEAIQKVANAILSHVRKTDLVARVGGEEFVGVLSDIALDAAISILERCRQHIESLVIPTSSSTISLTVSIGVTQLQPGKNAEHTLESLVKQADNALYQAKSSGRNQIVSFELEALG